MMLTIIFAGLSNLEGAAEFAKHLTTGQQATPGGQDDHQGAVSVNRRWGAQIRRLWHRPLAFSQASKPPTLGSQRPAPRGQNRRGHLWPEASRGHLWLRGPAQQLWTLSAAPMPAPSASTADAGLRVRVWAARHYSPDGVTVRQTTGLLKGTRAQTLIPHPLPVKISRVTAPRDHAPTHARSDPGRPRPPRARPRPPRGHALPTCPRAPHGHAPVPAKP